MARGRMISTTLGRSKKYNQLPDDFTKLVYIHALTSADEKGRIEADTVAIYGDHFVIHPDANLDRIETALQALHAAGLIVLYAVEDKRYAQFTDFNKHNTIWRKKDGTPQREGVSRIPAPDDNCATPAPDRAETAQKVRSDRTDPYIEVEVQDQVQHQVQEKSMSPTGDDLATIPKQRGGDKPDLDQLLEAWNDNRGPLPAAMKLTSTRRSKLKTLIRDLGSFDKAHAAVAIAAAEVAHDQWWQKHGYGLDNLLAGQKVIQKAETAWNRGTFDRAEAERQRMLAALGPN